MRPSESVRFFAGILVGRDVAVVAGVSRALGHSALLLCRWPVLWVTLARVYHLITEVHTENFSSSFTLTAGNRTLWNEQTTHTHFTLVQNDR